MCVSGNARILLVDDNIPFLTFISSLLRQHSNVEVVGVAREGKEAVRLAQSLEPDIILLDIGLPTLNGIQAAYEIRKLVPEIKIVFVSNEASREVVQEALNLGACGYIQKICAAKDIALAISAVLNGGRFLSSKLAEYDLVTVA